MKTESLWYELFGGFPLREKQMLVNATGILWQKVRTRT